MGDVRVRVYEETGDPIQGATVRVRSTDFPYDQTLVTDILGEAYFSGAPAGVLVVIDVSYPNYDPQRREITVGPSGTYTYTFNLVPSAPPPDGGAPDMMMSLFVIIPVIVGVVGLVLQPWLSD